ncbi:hypothetical protein ACFFX0_05220 [Citricoccus parietis]|uniref:Uncharacterized protein n=1 Tax=Citricoccus parietis TaxID=592307 RepID=A0ABV5FVB8_9MICC
MPCPGPAGGPGGLCPPDRRRRPHPPVPCVPAAAARHAPDRGGYPLSHLGTRGAPRPGRGMERRRLPARRTAVPVSACAGRRPGAVRAGRRRAPAGLDLAHPRGAADGGVRVARGTGGGPRDDPRGHPARGVHGGLLGDRT